MKGWKKFWFMEWVWQKYGKETSWDKKMEKRKMSFLFIGVILFFLNAIAKEITQERQERGVYYFFNKDSHDASNNPNWFHFWSQFIPKGRIQTLIFDNTIPGYASTAPERRRTRVSQRASEYNDETGHRGIHTFYEVLAHESHHIVLWERWWPNGYNSSQDVDGDCYPDEWERNDPEARRYGFRPPGQVDAEKDHYGYMDDTHPYGTSPGYVYEEDKCRQVEHAINETAFDSQDWSYDSTGINQGKMWLGLP